MKIVFSKKEIDALNSLGIRVNKANKEITGVEEEYESPFEKDIIRKYYSEVKNDNGDYELNVDEDMVEDYIIFLEDKVSMVVEIFGYLKGFIPIMKRYFNNFTDSIEAFVNKWTPKKTYEVVEIKSEYIIHGFATRLVEDGSNEKSVIASITLPSDGYTSSELSDIIRKLILNSDTIKEFDSLECAKEYMENMYNDAFNNYIGKIE